MKVSDLDVSPPQHTLLRAAAQQLAQCVATPSSKAALIVLGLRSHRTLQGSKVGQALLEEGRKGARANQRIVGHVLKNAAAKVMCPVAARMAIRLRLKWDRLKRPAVWSC